MNCLRCTDRTLDERVREGVVVDVCPSCRGVWLDRGELEKLLARLGRDEDDDDEDDFRDDRRPRGRREFDDDDDRHGPRHPGGGRRGGLLDSLTRMFD